MIKQNKKNHNIGGHLKNQEQNTYKYTHSNRRVNRNKHSKTRNVELCNLNEGLHTEI